MQYNYTTTSAQQERIM